METRIVHSGRQSMPLYYDNSKADTKYKSEAERTWTAAQDWTIGGVDTLQLFFRGNPVDFLENPSGGIVLSGAGADIWGTADEFRFAFKTLTGNGSIVAKVDRLVDRDAWTKAGVMIRQSLDVDSAFAAVYMTGDSGVHYQARLRAMVDAVSDTRRGHRRADRPAGACLDQDRAHGRPVQRLLLHGRREMDRHVLESADARDVRPRLHRSWR